MSKKEYNKQWHIDNKAKVHARQAEYWKANKKDLLARQKIRRANDKDYYKKYNARKHGLTLNEYNQMFIDCNNQCEICGVDNSDKRLNVDHNHITGKIRGLLCLSCNTAIGHLKSDDNLDLLIKAIEYIENDNEQINK